MPFENANFIKDLVATNPTGSDEISLGDDHLRSLKRVFDNTFSGLEGTTGTPKAITKTEDEINDLVENQATEVITGDWEFTLRIEFRQGITLHNDKPVTGREFDGGSTVGIERDLVRLSPADVALLGNNTTKTELRAGTADADAILLSSNTTVQGDLVSTTLLFAPKLGSVIQSGPVIQPATETMTIYDAAGVEIGLVQVHQRV